MRGILDKIRPEPKREPLPEPKRYEPPRGKDEGAARIKGARSQGENFRYAIVAAALDHTRMQEGIAGPIGKLYEAESLVGVVPFDYGLHRGTGRRVKPLGTRSRCRSETGRGVSKLSSSKPRRRLGRKSLSLLLT